MTIKNLVVMLDDSEGCASRVDAAVVMAEKYDAHLTGVYAQAQQALPANLGKLITRSLQQGLDEALQNALETAAEQSHAVFSQKLAAAGREDKAQWHALSGDPNRVASLIARYADLVIAGQLIPGEADGAAIDPRDVVFDCGRPLLIIPQSYTVRDLTGHAVIGWNRSREAARALADAMLILETKTRVTVVSVAPESNPQGDLPFNIVEHLRRHNINATKVDVPLQEKDPGIQLMKYAEAVDADLLVMGAYSRSRWREQMMGGATCSIMRKMVLPVLMSH